MPEDTRRVAGGTRESKGWERQASAAEKEKTRPEAQALLGDLAQKSEAQGSA